MTKPNLEYLHKAYRNRLQFAKHSKHARRQQPKCAGRCEETDNLTEVTATPMPTGTYHLCPRCLADEEQQS